MEDLLRHLVAAIIDHPEDIQIDRKERRNGTVLELRVIPAWGASSAAAYRADDPRVMKAKACTGDLRRHRGLMYEQLRIGES